MFYSTREFPFTIILENQWRLIERELRAIHPRSFAAWPEKFLYEGTWNVFGFYAFGQKMLGNCALCPDTTRLLESIPGMTTAGFSFLKSGTVIKPHFGYSDSVLRCHLGLIIPEECGLRVGTETQRWENGKCIVFDDTIEHEAWNNGNSDRTVLLIDFKR
jgi:beta-hydroxylase